MTLRTVKLFAQLHVSALDEQPSLVYMLPTIHILRTLLSSSYPYLPFKCLGKCELSSNAYRLPLCIKQDKP